MHNSKTNRSFILTAFLLLCGSVSFGQSDCELYQWPEVISPCPEVQIKQKHDHTSKPQYRHYGWDTVIDCNTREGITLSCMPYIPVQFFNGTYSVEQIPYNPPDTTFSRGIQMPITTDDNFGPVVQIEYPFYFFGIRKTSFVLGANGLVTFNPTAALAFCPYNVTAPLPWPDGTSGAPTGSDLPHMRDAIYGVFEDTHPLSSYLSGTQGIYYGILDTFPCRKILCSWNEVPEFSGQVNNRCTYQIVCYEGSNIIEVHVKRRGQGYSSWPNGFVGIQNATGSGQVKSNDPLAPNFFVQNGAPAAFFPTGYNPKVGSFTNTAFRFTPQPGPPTNKTSKWFRIFDDGRDSVDLPEYDPVNSPEAMNDTNGYVIPMDPMHPTCPTLTKAFVKPSMPSKYVYLLRFKNANGDWYNLTDTIFIGIDTVNDLSLVKNNTEGDPHILDICQGQIAAMSLKMTDLQEIDTSDWHVYRELNGEQTELPNTLLHFGTIATFDTVRTLPVTLNTGNLPTPPRNKIDSIYVRGIVDFTSGCLNNDIILIRVFPNFDTVIHDGICQGETYNWSANGATYTTNTDPTTTFVTLQSAPGCDSTVHLALTVFDVSHTDDVIDDCDSIVWLDGQTYRESNYTATWLTSNQYGCDSIIHLKYTLYPLTARLHSNVDHFSLDNLDAILTDVSTNGNGRVWKLPSMPDQTSATAYYSIPVEMDGAEILLIESSEYGCIDTASIYIPLQKENFWVPNIFTPDNPAGNNTFGSISTKTLNQEMLIYNRRGELVFRCEGADCTWDGRDLNGNPCVQGAYVYIIRYTNEFEPKNTRVLRGTVTLLR